MSARYVLVRRAHGSWGTFIYVQRANPTLETESVYEARRFTSIALARALKKALGLNRTFAARAMPEWFR